MTLPATLHLGDDALTHALSDLARRGRGVDVELIRHLAEFEARQLHFAGGFSSLFEYCVTVLRLSEHETFNRIEAARASRSFPVLLEALSDGRLNLTSVRLIAPHLTEANHRELIDAAVHKRKREVLELIARRFPRPDIATSIRRVPAPRVPDSDERPPEPCVPQVPTSAPATVPP